MTLQPLTDAEISLLLAKESLDSPAAAKVGPTPELKQGVTAAYEAAEVVLAGCAFSCSGYDRFHSKELVFHPGRGLLVADRNGSDATPWRQAPEPVLAQCLPLLELLRRQHAELAPRYQTQVLVEVSKAVVEMAKQDAKPAEPVAEIVETVSQPAEPSKAKDAEDEDVPDIPEVLSLDDALMKASKTQTTGRAAPSKKTGRAKSGRR